MITIIGNHPISKEIYGGSSKHLFELAKTLHDNGIPIKIITPIKNINKELFNWPIEIIDCKNGYQWALKVGNRVKIDNTKLVIVNGGGMPYCYLHLTIPRYIFNFFESQLSEHLSFFYNFFDLSFHDKKHTVMNLPIAIFANYLENKMIKKSLFSATPSPLSKQFMSKKYWDKIKIIPCGVDEKYFDIKRRPEDFILNVGSPSPRKNQLELAKSNSHKIVIIGEKNTNYAAKLSSFKNINLLGNVSNKELFNLYSKAKIYVHCGSEGFGISILEAMASGCPVIVKNICGINEFLTHNYDALIYENEMQLKKYIELLWNDVEFYNKLSLNGKRTASKLSWELMGESWLELIKNLVIV